MRDMQSNVVRLLELAVANTTKIPAPNFPTVDPKFRS